MTPLWTSDEIVAATGGTASASFAVTGMAFDSREIEAGHLFVAMPGTQFDGHDFIAKAKEVGATAALVSRPVDLPHVLVEDVPEALEALAKAARTRLSQDAVVIGVTGSVGKTSTKEALYTAAHRVTRGRAHRSVKSYNNHTGVPLSLARMPRDTRIGVFEMGMNHAGEIAALTRLVRPHIAIVTAIAPAHIENLGTMDAIANAKAEIFEGLEEGGTAIVPEASDYRDRLIRAAQRKAQRTLTFGGVEGDAAALHVAEARRGGQLLTARLPGRDLTFTIAQSGDHWVTNALAVLTAITVAGEDVAVAGLALADMGGLAGRGERIIVPVDDGEAVLIDESYNANSASMEATLRVLGTQKAERRIVVLGDMKELGERSDELHRALATPIIDAKVGLALLVGEAMAVLKQPLEQAGIEAIALPDAEATTERLRAELRAGDAVLVKASNSMGLGKLVETVKREGPCST
ncbi:UDP-N-acetylmuramoyl-tripeptide--D-alanyl-D-alanine ligase [Sphingomicrobium sp. XHP0239]|uniref:UDP-N-acetylmuramoyl-tripeptide--D-alanyl-D- alanine ligase n=1 Tax=Sphingomicrobium maritimum TaxID=3133972 RepID=UPI0031CC38D3